ncbi:ATP-binding protein [Clostridium butyricum]|uniref:ATP-binding protein n=1 Tax=Clostridium butyricum TaxID=1492 RepID=UPI0022E6278C|nr:ATP-binding protein [Clostridium butyricum]
MNNDILKVGEVIEVRGQKVRAKVYEQKNSLYINYNGNVVKNISVGGFIKIRTGFSSIIGKIEGEYIVEDNNFHKYKNSTEEIKRILEISIVGCIDSSKKFKRGLTQLPLVSNYIYVLKEEEVEEVFTFSKKNEAKIQIGNIISYEDYKLRLGVQELFASHIGIFGNTGSGKSNTLAKIYTELFNIYSDNDNFKKNSKFLLIDFNGEYENSICKDKYKKVYHLSTRKECDKYPLDIEYLFEVEFWSIITEATEKTQQPFLKSCIKKFKEIVNTDDICEEVINEVNKIFNNIFNCGDKYMLLRSNYQELLDIFFKNISDDDKRIFNILVFNSTNNSFYIKRTEGGYDYLNNFEEFKNNQYVNILNNKLIRENCNFNCDNINYFDLFYFAVKIMYLGGLQRSYINEEHIAPLIKRLDIRLNDIRKVFISGIGNAENRNMIIVSLVDVNINMRKIIPMIICKKEYDKQKLAVERKFFNIIIDEAHNILSCNSERESAMWKDYRLEVFEEIIKEGRKFGTFLTIASQRPSDISDTLISQLHNYFLHRLVNNEDIKAIGKSVSFLDNASYEMIPILPQGACIFTGMASNFPVLVQVDKLEEDKQPKSKTIRIDELWNNNL